MTNKIAIVTGASSGVGKAVAIHLAKQNYHVVLIARSQNKLSTVLEEIIQNNGAAEICPLDVSDAKSVSRAIKNIASKHGHIDFLFNNAGILKHGTIDISDEDLDELLRINLNGAIYMAKNVAIQMQKQRSGYIVNVSSTGGKIAMSFGGVYAAAKFGLAGYCESLTKNMSSCGVKVTTIFPGMIATEMVAKDRDFKPDDMIQVSDIVKTVDYLLSLSAAALPTEILIYPMPIIEKITQLTNQAFGLNEVKT